MKHGVPNNISRNSDGRNKFCVVSLPCARHRQTTKEGLCLALPAKHMTKEGLCRVPDICTRQRHKKRPLRGHD